jgi:hypothetical protein
MDFLCSFISCNDKLICYKPAVIKEETTPSGRKSVFTVGTSEMESLLVAVDSPFTLGEHKVGRDDVIYIRRGQHQNTIMHREIVKIPGSDKEFVLIPFNEVVCVKRRP